MSGVDHVGLFGYNTGAISNLGIVSGSVTGYQRVGGVVGRNSGTITACYNQASVTGNQLVGGVIGSNYGAVTASYNTGAVNGTIYVGGVAAYNTGSGTITASYNTGAINGTDSVGGVVGEFTGCTVTACYAKTYVLNGINAVAGTIFSDSNWPSDSVNAQWGLATTDENNGTSGHYWDSLGGWNEGSLVYPKLWWE